MQTDRLMKLQIKIKKAEKEDKQKGTGTNVTADQNKEAEKEDTQKETGTNVMTGGGQIVDREEQKETTGKTNELEMVLEPSSEISRQGGDSVQEIASDEEVEPKRKKVRNN